MQDFQSGVEAQLLCLAFRVEASFAHEQSTPQIRSPLLKTDVAGSSNGLHYTDCCATTSECMQSQTSAEPQKEPLTKAVMG